MSLKERLTEQRSQEEIIVEDTNQEQEQVEQDVKQAEDSGSEPKSLKGKMLSMTKKGAKTTAKVAKQGAQDVTGKTSDKALSEFETYRDAKRAYNKTKNTLNHAKGAKNKTKAAGRGLKKAAGFIKTATLKMWAFGPVGVLVWVILVLLILRLLSPMFSDREEDIKLSFAPFITAQAQDRNRTYVVVLEDDCPPNTDFTFNAGEIEKGSGEGLWTQRGTDAYNRAKFFFEALVSMGWSNYTAAAAVGNAAIESGWTFHPAIIETAYKDMYARKMPLGSMWLSPSPDDYTGDRNGHGQSGRGLIQTSPGSLVKDADGTNGFKWVDVFSGDDWEKNLVDRNKIAAGIINEIEYMMLARSGAGLGSTGYQGIRDAVLNGGVVGGHRMKEDFWEANSVRQAVEEFFFFIEIGDMSVFSIAGGENRIKHAEFAFKEFSIAGADKPDYDKLKKIGDGEYSLKGTPTNAKCEPESDVDLSDVLEIAKALEGALSYSQSNRTSPLPALKSDDPVQYILDKGPNVMQTDCSGYIWLVYSIAGYKMPEWMDWTGSIHADAHGPGKYWQLVPASEAKAGDIIVHHGSPAAHTAILLEDWKGKASTPIIEEGGMTGDNVGIWPSAASISEPYFFARPKYKVND